MPSSRRSGTSVTPSNGASAPNPWARGRSPWATVTQSVPGLGQAVDTGPHRAVEALSGLPHDGRAELRRPSRHVLVVADHGDGQRHAGRHDVRGHGADERDALAIGQGGPEPPLGLVEGLDRDQDDLGPQRTSSGSRRMLRCRHGGPRHRDSVRVGGAWRGRRRLLRHERPGGGDRCGIVGHRGGDHRRCRPSRLALGALARARRHPWRRHARTRRTCPTSRSPTGWR